MNHYVYQITYNTGKKYIGVRSCSCSIEADTYMGSAFHLPENIIGCKEILSIHTSREEAMLEEIRLHALYNVKDNPDFYNQCNATTTKFQVSADAHKRSAATRTGRTSETHAYIQKQVESRKKYKGEGLTLAQRKQWDSSNKEARLEKYRNSLAKTLADPEKAKAIKEAQIRGGKSCTGIPNPKKAHKGIEHPRVKPWWYKHPNGTVTIVTDSIRNYVQVSNVFPMSSASIMRYIRTKEVPKKLLIAGWDFGLIDEQELTTPVE